MIQSDMFTFVRTQADADTVDAPDANLTVYARMAYNDILSRRTSWPHLSVEYTLTTTPGTSDYPFTSFSTNDMDILTSVTPTTNLGMRVIYITPTDATLYYGPSTAQSTQATSYTVVGNQTLRLYPTPSSAVTYQVTGFRNAATWPAAAGSTPDLPTPFHDAICFFMLAQYYSSQEDTAMANHYMIMYQDLVNKFLSGDNTKRYSPRPSRVGGNNRLYVPNFIERQRMGLE